MTSGNARASAPNAKLPSLADIDFPGTRFARLRHHLFISYARAEEAQAAALFDSLSRLRVFFAPEALARPVSLDDRATWFRPIEHALYASCHCICLVSRAYLQRSWCLLEMHGFFNVSRDSQRRQWIYLLEDLKEDLPPRFEPLRYPGTLPQLKKELRRACIESALRPGNRVPNAPLSSSSACFRGLPLERLYGNERRPWRSDGRGPAMPIGPRYADYEALVREYMVKILRGADPQSVWLDPPDMDGRATWVAKEARDNARRLLEQGVSPFQGTRSSAELLADIEQARAQGEDSSELDRLQGLACLMAGAHATAVEYLERGLRKNLPSSEREYWLSELAMAHYCLKNYARALDILSSVRRPSARTLRLKAACLARSGRMDASKRALRLAVELEPACSLRREAFDLVFERNEDAAHWLEGLRLAGLARD
jgi:tetratricopeptide (TPR) repeat protein